MFSNLIKTLTLLPAFLVSFLRVLKVYKFEVSIAAIIILIALLTFFNIRILARLIYAEFLQKNRGKKVWQYVSDKKKPEKNILQIWFYFKEHVRQFFNIISIAGKQHNKYKRINFARYRVRIPSMLYLAISIVFCNLILLSAIAIITKENILPYPNFQVIYPKENEVWDDFDRPIEIVFDTPIDEQGLIINMAPDTDGEWIFEKSYSFLPFYRSAKFYPKETIMPGNKVMIYLTDLNNYFWNHQKGEHLITFKSLTLPSITSSTPSDRQVDVPVEDDIVFTLDQTDGYYVDWTVEFDKNVDFKMIRENNAEVRLHLNSPLKQGKKYRLSVYQEPVTTNLETGEIMKRGEKSLVKEISFTTVTPPLIDSIHPEGSGILPNENIKIGFDQPMVQDSVEDAFSISPEIQGEMSWENDKTFVFKPSGLSKETHYDVKLAKGIKSRAGGLTEEAIEFSFDTIGKVRVAGWLPYYNSSGISVGTNVNVTFDQAVDHSSAQNKFSISPSIDGSFSWNGNTMIFNPSANLKHSTTYTITIDAGVKTVYGLDSSANFTLIFTTEHQTIILNVPQYYQTHAFTCNVTAAAMAMGYKGVSASEMSVYNGVSKDNTDCKKDGSGTITEWGNPHSGYVGSIDGTGNCGGYGVYWGPVSSYMSGRGVSNQVFSGWSVSQLAQEIEKGHPAVIWGQNGWSSPYDKSWNTPGGTRIYAINGMHSEVAVGFIGSSSNPTHIITNDPWRGRRTHTVAEFNVFWGYFGHTGIVVY